MTQSNNQIRKAYDLAADAYAEKFLSELDHKPQDVELLSRFAMELGIGSQVLDLGCGPGQTTVHLSSLGLKPKGVDLSPRMVSIAKETFPDLEFVMGDLLNLQDQDHSFAGVLAFYCIVHLHPDRLSSAFSEMLRVLQPGGLLLAAFHIGTETVFVEDFLESGAELEFFSFPVKVIESAMKSVGFIDVDSYERAPYETEYPSQRCYVFARKPA